MKYAVVKIGGAQYRVSEGDEIEVDKLTDKEGDLVNFNQVLLFAEDGKVKIGKPEVKDIQVSARILKHYKGEKIDVFKFKAKTGYRRKMGFRPEKSLLKIEKISPKP